MPPVPIVGRGIEKIWRKKSGLQVLGTAGGR